MKIFRKSFLKSMLGLTLSLAGFLYPGAGTMLHGAARAHEHSPTPNTGTGQSSVRRLMGPDPTYAGGEVIEKTPQGVILQSFTGLRAIRIPPGTVVWKEFETTPEAIQLHDWLDVKGTPLDDGTLLAQSGWVFVNIGRREGVIEGLSAGGLVLRHSKGVETIELSPRLEVISASTGQSLPGGPGALKPGLLIGAVGIRLPNGGFRATRIWTK